MSNENLETVEFVQWANSKSMRWQPIVGEETGALMERLRIEGSEKEKLKDQAVSILSKCIPPEASTGSLTGLAVGYVQSGKTMSFNTLIALARDNRYPLVILIAGTATHLYKQSTLRLKQDLGLDRREDRQWMHFEVEGQNKLSSTSAIQIRNTFDEWLNNSVADDEKRTVLLTVMKHHRHLDTVRSVLSQLKLERIPTLIIDDEADQASLNAKVNRGEESTTYARILSLREALPHHTFLQYTATPQAPLLINLIDMLSPRFAELLVPGSAYTGARTFFQDKKGLVHYIPEDDIYPEHEDSPETPDSLMHAMRVYFLGVASGLHSTKGSGNRSMLVHPSRKTSVHKVYYRVIHNIKRRWQDDLSLPQDDPDHENLLQEFHEAYMDLAGTVSDLPAFETLVAKLPQAIQRTQIQEVNATSGQTPAIDWKMNYAHILVGGQAMDRGFTIEGLTVTYMPRSLGTGNVDTILQRARFFGYKASYLGYCRIYLEPRVFEAFTNLVEHEESIRDQLRELAHEGQPLKLWKRAFFLDRKLQPTRSSVISWAYARGNFANHWFWPKAPHYSQDILDSNRLLVQEFCSSLRFEEDEGDDRRTPEQRHNVAREIPLRWVFENLLVPYSLGRLDDSQSYTGLRLQVEQYLANNPDEVCDIYEMSKGAERKRELDTDDEIPNLFQGRNPEKGKGAAIYPGDREIKRKDQLTVQIHRLRVTQAGRLISSDVPTLAIWVPKDMSRDWLVQDQDVDDME